MRIHGHASQPPMPGITITFPLQIFLHRGDVGVGDRARCETRLRLEQRVKQDRRAEHFIISKRITERRVLS